MAEKSPEMSILHSSEDDNTLPSMSTDNSHSGVIDVVLTSDSQTTQEQGGSISLKTDDSLEVTKSSTDSEKKTVERTATPTADKEVQTENNYTADKEVQTTVPVESLPASLARNWLICGTVLFILTCFCFWLNLSQLPNNMELKSCLLEAANHSKARQQLMVEVNLLNNSRMSLKNEVESFQNQTHELEKLNKELESNTTWLKQDKQRLETRLSEVMKTVVDDHDDLTQLEDHSKFKIEREYKELYDNEYTRASIEMQKLGLKLETQKMTQFFLDILKMSNNLCMNYSTKHLNAIKQSITNLPVDIPLDHEKEKYYEEFSSLKDEISTKVKTVNVTIDSKLSKIDISKIFDVKRTAAVRLQEPVIEILSKVVATEFNVDKQHQPKMLKFINKCLQLCWMMNMHLDPVFIDFVQVSDSILFDSDTFKPYLSSGKYIDYVVWPPLYSYNGGKLLLKGIAEGRN